MILKAFSTDYFKALLNIRKDRIVFFNGCFDIIHPGHLKLINNVKNRSIQSGAIIICAINSNESAKLQNKSHPLVNDENVRAEMMEMLGIDYVIIFDEKSPLSLIMSIMPNSVMTTLDYYQKRYEYDDLKFCLNHDIIVDYISIEKKYSTTNIYKTIEEQVKAKIKENL